MPSVVHRLPSRIDEGNVDDVREIVADLIDRYHSVTLDCTDLTHITSSGMRVLEGAARTGSVTLVHATPVVHLLASVFGVDVSFTEDREIEESPAEVARLQELAAARAELQVVDRTDRGLSQFERARLRRIESQIDGTIDELRRQGSLRDRLPDAY